MKKFLIIFLIAVLCLSIFSCEKEEEANNNETNNTLIDLVEYKVVSAPMTDGPIIMDMAKDNNNNYYLLDLGYVKNVPLSYSAIFPYDGKSTVTIQMSKSSINEASVSNSLTTAVAHTISDTKIGSATFQINQAFEYAIGETGFGFSYSREWGNTTENSISTTNAYEMIEAKTEGTEIVFSQTIGGNGEEEGNYKALIMATCDVLALVTTSPDNSRIEEFSYIFNARNEIKFGVIYSKDGIFPEATDNKIDLPDDFYKKLPIPTNNIGSSDEEIIEEVRPKPQYEKITTVMPPQSCVHDTWYDKSKPGNSVSQSRHDGFNMGVLNLYGCTQADNKYIIGDKESFAIRYEVQQDYNNVPVANVNKTTVTNDVASKVNGTSINSKVGYGAYWIRINFKDGSQTEYYKTDMFKNTSKGTVLDLVTKENTNSKDIEKIEIVVVYELYLKEFWWDAHVDFRCEYTYEFIN